MKDYLSQARVALRVYHDRGEAALKLIDDGNLEELQEILFKRKAAFYNFKVADQLALDNGKDIARLEETVQLMRQIEKVDELLEKGLVKSFSGINKKISKISSLRKNLGKYHSGERPGKKIVKSV